MKFKIRTLPVNVRYLQLLVDCGQYGATISILTSNPNGAILRLDISDGFAEITQNGTMNRNMILKDWLSTPRVTLDGAGAVMQAHRM